MLWGTPIAKLVMNVSGAVMLGALVLALFGLRAGERSFDAALNIASVGAAVFTVSAGLAGFLAFMAAFNPKLSIEREFGTQLGRFLLELPLGQSWLITTIFGAIITVLAFAWRSWTPTLITALLAAVSFLPLATQGHAGDLAGPQHGRQLDPAAHHRRRRLARWAAAAGAAARARRHRHPAARRTLLVARDRRFRRGRLLRGHPVDRGRRRLGRPVGDAVRLDRAR